MYNVAVVASETDNFSPSPFTLPLVFTCIWHSAFKAAGIPSCSQPLHCIVSLLPLADITDSNGHL